MTDGEHGTITHDDGVTVTSNAQTSEEMRATADRVAAEAPPEPAKPAAEPVTTPETPTPNKQEARRSQAAKIQQQSGELANRTQTIETLNQRIVESDQRFAALQRDIDALKAPRATREPERTPERQPEPREPEIDWSGFRLKQPTIDDFADRDDPYLALSVALAKYEIKRDTYGEQQLESRTQAQQAQEKAFTDRTTAFSTRLSALQQADETFSARIETLLQERGNPPMPPPMFEVLTESEVGPQLYLHLLEHTDALNRVLQAPSPKAMYGEMKKLEARVEAAGSTGSALPVKKTTTAHPPINPVVGSHPAPHDGPPGPSATQEEFDAYWNKKDREDRQASAGRR